MNDWLLTEDVAAELGVSRSTVQEWVSRCLIPHRKPAHTRRCFIPRREFEDWLEGANLETRVLPGGGRVVRVVRPESPVRRSRRSQR